MPQRLFKPEEFELWWDSLPQDLGVEIGRAKTVYLKKFGVNPTQIIFRTGTETHLAELHQEYEKLVALKKFNLPASTRKNVPSKRTFILA